VNRAMLQALATVALTASSEKSAVLAEPLRCPLVLQGLHLAESHPDRKTRILADGGFRLRSAPSTGFVKGALDDRLEIRLGQAHRVICHSHRRLRL